MFWAGMSTTQRSESMNAFFDGYLNSKTTLKQFVEQYDEALKKKIENENIADFSSFNSTIPLITDFEFEKQFQNAYTHDMFRKFQAEIRGMICCNVSLLGSKWHVSTYQVCDVAKGKDGKERKVLYNVLFSEVEFEVLCLCHLFEFKGIVCRHILKVLLERNIRELPGEYILDRWRKCIKRNHNYVKNCYEDLVTKEEMVRQSSLYTIFCQISDAAVKSIEKYEFLRENLEILHEKMSTLEFNVDDGDTIPCEDGCSRLRIRSPLKVRSKGRPPVKRKESRIYRLSNKGKKSGNCSKDVVGVDK
ncbi:hypothetical protein L1049_007695 [Liquidambar formosana]|uniref:Protein FAR1-RELATED SEQUENCE n=1 Tax=Liquidambar formosana TaxID=63359 RepID=A0AAP0X1S4_LIQFO